MGTSRTPQSVTVEVVDGKSHGGKLQRKKFAQSFGHFALTPWQNTYYDLVPTLRDDMHILHATLNVVADHHY